MKVALPSIELDDLSRRAIADWHGETGLATRKQITDFVNAAIEGALESAEGDAGFNEDSDDGDGDEGGAPYEGNPYLY